MFTNVQLLSGDEQFKGQIFEGTRQKPLKHDEKGTPAQSVGSEHETLFPISLNRLCSEEESELVSTHGELALPSEPV